METAKQSPAQSKVPNRKTLWRYLAAFAALCILVAGLKAIHHARQPKYQGKTMEEWYAEVSIDAIWVMREGELASYPPTIGLKKLGTNALWFLWREHCRDDAKPAAWYARQRERFEVPAGVHWFNHEQKRKEITALLLQEFGPAAEPLIPEILARLNTGNQRQHEMMARLLGTIRRQPELVLPALVRSFSPTNQAMNDNYFDIHAIGEFGPAAAAYVPELKSRLANPVNRTRGLQTELAEAILLINGPGPELQVLTKQLRPGDYSHSYSGLTMFERVGTNARPAVPDLLRFAQTFTNTVESNHVMAVIRKLDPEGIYHKP